LCGLSGAVRAQQSSCSFSAAQLPSDTIVVAAGAYGGRELSFQIDQSGHAARQFDVIVHSEKPVALLLGAYEPTIWSISWTKETRVVAVYATGYYRQAVAGLPKETPLIISSGRDAQCGRNFFSNEAGAEWVNPKSREVFVRAASRLYSKDSYGLFNIVESTRPKSERITSPDTAVESFIDRSAPLASTAGLNDAVAKGIIRRLTGTDIEDVREHYRRLAAGTSKLDVPPLAEAKSGEAPSVRIPTLRLDRAYLVLKEFTYPSGLHGAHLAYFVVVAILAIAW
jgi:hypothetical protein